MTRAGRFSDRLLVLACLVALGTGCASDAAPGAPRGAGAPPVASAPPAGPSAGRAAPGAAVLRPPVRVSWEALAVERERFENPRIARRAQTGLAPTLRVVVVNQSHPAAGAQVQESGIAPGVVPDGEMDLFVRGLEERGFFRLARPTEGMEALTRRNDARGRITVERDGRSWTLVSMRGQGLNESTKEIPALYSDVKQAILLLRNRTPTMGIVTAGAEERLR